MKDLKKKTDYFLNSCNPVVEDGVLESIHKKTFAKIEKSKEHSNLIPISNPGKKRKLWPAVLSATAAAAAILIVSIFSIQYISSDKSFMDIVALTEQEIHENKNNEILLILSDSRQIEFTQDEIISFTSEGTLANATTTSTDKSSNSQSLNQLIVPKGKSSQLLLSDGTRIWVNAGTKIVFPEVFSDKKRDIYIDGEAYMEVAHNPDQPFYVTTNDFKIKVLGTSFNVFAYKEDDIKEVALVSGKIEIADGHNQVLEMKPDELVTFSENRISDKKQVNAKDYRSWIDKTLILNGETLNAIAHRLSLTYGVNIFCSSSIEGEEVFGKLDLKNNIEEILNYLELMLPLSVEKDNGEFYLKRK